MRDGIYAAIAAVILSLSNVSFASQNIDVSQVTSTVIWDANGQPVSLSAIKGRKVILSFYASWCSECALKVKNLNELNSSASGKYDVIGISLDNDTAKARMFALRHGMKYYNLVGGDIAKALMSSLGNEKKSVPFTVVLNKSGVIDFSKIGSFSNDDILDVINR